MRQAVQHVCLSGQGYPDWLDGLIAARPSIAVPLVGDAFAEEWAADENGNSYFLYHFAQNGTAIQSDLQKVIFDIIAGAEPKQINTLDRGLGILRNLTPSSEQRVALQVIALARFNAHKKANPSWAARYVALLFLLGDPSVATTLIKWLRSEKPGKRKGIIITVLGLLFGNHSPLIAGVLAGLSVPVLSELLLFAYQEVRPDEDRVHEGSYTPDDRDDAENARNAILKALVDSEGAAAFKAMLRLSAHRNMKSRRIRFLELARRMAERDADVSAWRPADVLAFERDKILPVKSAPQLYKLVQAVINEIGWEFDNADASTRAVLETARNEDAVQEWLVTEIRHRAKGRYHVTRESEIAEGNMPDALVAAVGALVEVAVEAKHGGKGWSTKSLEDALRHQLAEDYLRPENRRHGVLVVTNHKKRGWLHPATRKNLSFEEMIAYLNSVAAALTVNSVGEIAVTAIGIDALKKPRKRSLREPAGKGIKKRRPAKKSRGRK